MNPLPRRLRCFMENDRSRRQITISAVMYHNKFRTPEFNTFLEKETFSIPCHLLLPLHYFSSEQVTVVARKPGLCDVTVTRLDLEYMTHFAHICAMCSFKSTLNSIPLSYAFRSYCGKWVRGEKCLPFFLTD